MPSPVHAPLVPPITLSIIVPAYNEARTIEAVIEKVLAADIGEVRKQIIIVDDCSSDDTGCIIDRLAASHREQITVHHAFINLGKGSAVRIGFKLAHGDIVIIQDADLELDPSEYRHIIKPIIDGDADVVYGSRFLKKNKNVPLSTRVANRMLTILTNILYACRLTDMETCYKAFRREVLNSIRLKALEFEIEPELTARIRQKGYKIHEVPVRYAPRTKAEGKKMDYIMGVEAAYTLFHCKLRK